MSLLIKGMDMPAVGAYEFTLFCFPDGTACAKGFFIKFKGEPFEVVEVPTPHGRLIDADAKIEAQLYDEMREDWRQVTMTVDRYLAYAADLPPTIIEAEEGEE